MPDITKIAAVEAWLSTNWPGGEWILPHWQDGPYWLVPLTRSAGESPHVAGVLDAHEPLVANLPNLDGYGSYSGVTVYALGKFALHQCEWHHEPDGGLELDHEGVVGPFDTVPTAADLVEALPGFLGFGAPHGFDEAEIAPAMEVLRAADPAQVLGALTSLFAASTVPLRSPGPGQAFPGSISIVSFLDTVAAVAAAPQ